MLRKLGFGLLWLGFVSYAFLLAPPQQPDTFTLIQNLSTGQWDGINPIIIALFNLMGIWPMIFACLLFFDGRGQKLPAWPFASLSFGVGAFSLLPYLALRQPNPEFTGEKDNLLKLLDSRWTGLAIGSGAIALLAFAFLAGDWANFIGQWQTSRFIHVMSLDFCLLCGLFPALLGDDMARRGWQNSPLFWLFCFPLLGAIAYLIARPPLPTAEAPQTTPNPV
ncbi:MAG: DUF2834 domain-containing protein [Desertifilum sp. SIO1I2]|nr:DUF2834 domain-containing protein [Desertifilum sp. SIO1I2]